MMLPLLPRRCGTLTLIRCVAHAAKHRLTLNANKVFAFNTSNRFWVFRFCYVMSWRGPATARSRRHNSFQSWKRRRVIKLSSALKIMANLVLTSPHIYICMLCVCCFCHVLCLRTCVHTYAFAHFRVHLRLMEWRDTCFRFATVNTCHAIFNKSLWQLAFIEWPQEIILHIHVFMHMYVHMWLLAEQKTRACLQSSKASNIFPRHLLTANCPAFTHFVFALW